MTENAERWMTVSEICVFSRRSDRTVREALRTGALLGAQAGAGCSWRALRSEVDAWVQRGASSTTRRKFRAA